MTRLTRKSMKMSCYLKMKCFFDGHVDHAFVSYPWLTYGDASHQPSHASTLASAVAADALRLLHFPLLAFSGPTPQTPEYQVHLYQHQGREEEQGVCCPGKES